VLDKDKLGRVLLVIGESFGGVAMLQSYLVGKLWGCGENVLHFCVFPLFLLANKFLELDKDKLGRVLLVIGESFGGVAMLQSNLVGKLWGCSVGQYGSGRYRSN
jgi:hypothetical protein